MVVAALRHAGVVGVSLSGKRGGGELGAALAAKRPMQAPCGEDDDEGGGAVCISLATTIVDLGPVLSAEVVVSEPPPRASHVRVEVDMSFMQPLLKNAFISSLPNIMIPAVFDGLRRFRIPVMLQDGHVQHVLVTPDLLLPADAKIQVFASTARASTTGCIQLYCYKHQRALPHATKWVPVGVLFKHTTVQ